MQSDESLPHHGRHQLLRAFGGGLIIVVLAAAATATGGLLKVSDIARRLGRGGPHISNEGITKAQAGKPQTILILGSDRRFDEYAKNNKNLKRNEPARSDTMMLLHLDPNQPASTVLSLPRDLKVRIPGYGTDKLNASYSDGGPTLTVKTITELTGLQINHVVNVNFRGFREVVNAIGCVYVDVDRRYFNSNAGVPVGQRYAEINIDPGYQKLCGTDALDYVRYRHTDSDIVRAARQQAFLRDAKDQLSKSSLFSKQDLLIDIFGRNTQTDKALTTPSGLIKILKLALYSAGHPIRQIKFPAEDLNERLPGGAVISYVVASREAVRKAVDEFLHPPAAKTKPPSRPSGGGGGRGKRRRGTPRLDLRGLTAAQRSGENLVGPALAKSPNLDISLYFPKYIASGSGYANPGLRIYTLHDRAAKLRHAYRLVLALNAAQGQYYGVEGTDWPTPPILQATHVVIRRHGRRLGIYRDGSQIRLVSWRSGRGVYWVSNTLSNALSNSQMIAIAATLTKRFSSG